MFEWPKVLISIQLDDLRQDLKIVDWGSAKMIKIFEI